jgi:hypothetical protein
MVKRSAVPEGMVKLGRSKRQDVLVDARVVEQWQIEGYEKAVNVATVTGFRKAAAAMRRPFAANAPQAEKAHRIVRKYPSGYKSTLLSVDRMSLSNPKSVKTKAGKVRGTNFRYYAYVRHTQGYSVFVNYGHRIVTRTKQVRGKKAAVRYAERTLEQMKPVIIPILRAEWPK